MHKQRIGGVCRWRTSSRPSDQRIWSQDARTADPRSPRLARTLSPLEPPEPSVATDAGDDITSWGAGTAHSSGSPPVAHPGAQGHCRLTASGPAVAHPPPGRHHSPASGPLPSLTLEVAIARPPASLAPLARHGGPTVARTPQKLSPSLKN
jgi:hypothetical protein